MDNISKDYADYQRGKDYNNKLKPSYYQNNDIAERFYAGDQWNGVVANGLPTPVFNVFKRIIDFKIASILSRKVTMKFSLDNTIDEALQQKVDMLNRACEYKWEKDKLDSLLRDLLLDGAISGDYCVYVRWDPSIDTKQTYGVEADESGNPIPVEIKGDYITEIIDGQNVFFGNPNDKQPNKNGKPNQPYILLVGRGQVTDLRDEAKENGLSDEEIQKIVPDTDYTEQSGDRGKIEIDNQDRDDGKCLYIIRLYVKKGQIYLRKSTKFVTIIKEQPTENTLYPIVWGNWSKRKNSYHGQGEVIGLKDNQIAINQLFAMIIYHMRMTAFGKVIYDKSRIEKYDNRIGAAVGVEGDVTNAVKQIEPGQMNNLLINFIETIISTTKDLSGANDAALGDINPSTASGNAIVATQQAASIPLDNIKQGLYQFVEDLGLIWQDFITSKYKVPRKITYKENGKTQIGEINGQDYADIPISLKIDVGPSSYFSEINSVQTLNNLLAQKQISLIQFLERLPDGYVTDKQQLIDELKAAQKQEVKMQQDQQNMQMQQQQAMQEQQNQQMVQEQQTKNDQYEKMAQFFDSLPKDTQDKIKQLPHDQQETEVLRLMKQSVNQSLA